jgi:hypothetical protein
MRVYPKKKLEVKEHIEKRAMELARSGGFDGYQSIEFQLRFKEGFPEARSELDSRVTRMMLDTTCREAKAGKLSASRP